MEKEFLRLGLLIGEENLAKLKNSHVAVFGVGGVGSFAAEALVRSSIGEITLVDFDDVDISNLNRQIPALQSTVGKLKVEVMAERIKEINPNIKVNSIKKKYLPENRDEFFSVKYDYIVDAIDIITSKIDLIIKAKKTGTPVISSMGMGNKMDPTKIKISDIKKTSVCPLAKVMRKELKNRKIDKLLCVYSDEKPIKPIISMSSDTKREIPGSTGFVPSVAGLIMASRVVRDIIDWKEN